MMRPFAFTFRRSHPAVACGLTEKPLTPVNPVPQSGANVRSEAPVQAIVLN